MTSVARDKTFLNYFYDLASDDKQLRLNAANSLLIHIKNSLSNKQTSDPEYALKRLIRGLASSRDSARHGFATCLCELLVLPEMEIAPALKLLDENTKLSGSLKGSEERDFMFGKLFCYLAIIRSGKVAKDVTASVEIFDRILELHAKRGWIREVASEAILMFLSVASVDIVKLAVPKVSVLLNEIPLADLAAWQLMLLIGLQNLSAKNSAFKAEWSAVSTHEHFTLDRLEEVSTTLSAATAGYPKIHRVWDFILSQVFPMDSDRVLKTNRLKTFTASQEAALVALTRFIDLHLVSASKEKRCVAMTLSATLVKLCPAEFLPVALSKTVVRSIYASRVDRKHQLYHVAGYVIDLFVESTLGDNQSRLALVSVLVQYGGANFDSNTGTKAVTTLLEGMEAEEVSSHIKLLCSVIGTAQSSATAVETEANEDGEEQEESAPEDNQLATVSAALEAVTSMAKNSRISGRAEVCTQVVAVLVRLACFEQGVTKAYKAPVVESKTPKKAKSSKKRKGSDLDSDTEAIASAVASVHIYPNTSTIDTVRLTEQVLTHKFADEVAELAAVKLLALLADMGATTVHELGKKPSAESNGKPTAEALAEKEADSTPTLLQVAWQTLNYISKSGVALRDCSVEPAAEEVEETAVVSPADFIQQVEAAVKRNAALKVAVKDAASEENRINSGRNKLVDALNGLLTQSAFFALTSAEIERQSVLDIAAIVPQLVSKSGAPIKEEEEDEDEEEAEVDPLLPLFEACMDMLSVPSEHSIKGLRDAIKRVWFAVCALQGDDLALDVIDFVVSQVIGDDADEAPAAEKDEQEENDGGDDSEVDEEGDDSEEEESEEDEQPAKNGKATFTPTPTATPAKNSKKNNKAAAAKEQEQEEVMLSEEDALDLLAENMDDVDDEEFEANMQSMGLQHSVEHDDALAQMIALRKQNRKAGLLQARRRQMLIRSRAIDILEIIINRVELGDLLYPMFLPLLKCLSKCTASTLTQSIAEGKSYTHRLTAVIEQKLCKKKFRLVADGDEGAESAIVEESELLIAHLTKQLVSAHTSLRQNAHACLLSTARALIASDCEQGKVLLRDAIVPIFSSYCSKKNHRVPAKLIDDLLLNRFTSFFVPVLLPDLVKHLGTTKQTFTRSELCRMLQALLSKYKGMDADTQAVLDASLVSVVHALAAALESIASSEVSASEKAGAEEKSSGLSAKRFKAVLLCVKELLEFVRKNKQDSLKESAATATPGKNKAKAAAPTAPALLTAVQKLSATLNQHHDAHAKSNNPVVVKLVEQIAQTVATLQGNAPSSAATTAAPAVKLSKAEAAAAVEEQEVKASLFKKKEKKDKKRKAEDVAVLAQAEKAFLEQATKEKKTTQSSIVEEQEEVVSNNKKAKKQKK